MTAANTENRSRHIPVREDWLATRKEAALEPELPIIDPHHHLWDNASGVYLMPDLLADLGSGHNIISTVFMECRAMYRSDGDSDMAPLGEGEFVNGVAAMSASGAYGNTRVCEAIIGHANLTRGARAKGVLEALMRVSGGRFRGIRYSAVWHPEPSARGSTVSAPEGLLADLAFREGFACLAPLGLTYDAWVYHTQLGELTALARKFPDTTIITNHVGGAIGIGPYEGKRDEVLAEWRKGIAELAACPNVVMKIGGLGMRLFGFTFQNEATAPSSEQLAQAWRPMWRAASRRSAPHAACSRATFPSTKGAAAMPFCGMRSSVSAPDIRQTRGRRCSAERQRACIG
jgi:predicted TIM-barrel fold metal-dependent hydrolase